MYTRGTTWVCVCTRQGTCSCVLPTEREALDASRAASGSPTASAEEYLRALVSVEGGRWQDDVVIQGIILRLCAWYLVQVRFAPAVYLASASSCLVLYLCTGVSVGGLPKPPTPPPFAPSRLF